MNKSRNYRRDAAGSGQVFHRLSTYPVVLLPSPGSPMPRWWQSQSAPKSLPILDAADQPEQARDLLYPVLQRFTEGFGTADLRHAQTVLDQLA
jgi:hypothetical protein